MSDLRELRDRIIAVATGDIMDRVDAYVAACEQLAVAAALEQVAQGSRYISERIRALIPAEGADLLREHDSQLDSESDAAWEVRALQRERIARIEGMLEVANKLGHNWYGKVSYPCKCRNCEFQREIERELAQAQAASQEMKK